MSKEKKYNFFKKYNYPYGKTILKPSQKLLFLSLVFIKFFINLKF
jgi:hypothetical protein